MQTSSTKCEISKMEIHQGSLNTAEIYAKWHNEIKDKNLGAFIVFSGIIRDDNGVTGLSFDIHEPMLKAWFDEWVKRAGAEGAKVLMAHSVGDVLVGESSYLAAIISKQRKVALRLIDEYVEDFKANAPIWKYDLKDGKRIYAKKRSALIKGAGLLKDDK